MTDVSHILNSSFKLSTPAILSIVLVLLSAVDYQIPGVENFVPLVAMMCIFYWGIYWPSLIPAWFVFFLGVFQDFIYGTEFGIASLINLLLLKLVVVQRKYLAKENFWLIWIIFSFVLLIFSLFTAAIYSFYYSKLIVLDDVLLQWMFSALIYPLFHKIFSIIHVTFLKH